MKPRPALFLDRDGVVNRERGEHTWRLEDFEVLPGVAEVVAAFNRKGWAVVIVSNQSGIGLGLYTRADVERLHRYLHDHLHQHGAHVDDILYCPHHPSKGRCLCRKPSALLMERAIALHGIDRARSVMVGDRERDIEAAAGVGVRGVLIPSNAGLAAALEHAGIP
ncbi:MAG: HAD family hydrolase [Flavobacteriales bacterium]|jgi:D-glycero-D-manno-heptose 1,7-bisphosphate phosphatase|nr:HAD family hydrolase [Flavobacteriales bacterium]MBK7941132.1 HAD family hydrolase [Flavobacteriales bacterium]MBK8948788.1 HAD family hydrolase [Flavobacteriales bacterium]MBK9701158.1 HAD family hydrolase [Flavobacteriales bacterium]